jgi:translation initiation factor 1
MKKNLFEMGAKFEDSWSSDNKKKAPKKKSVEIKEPSKHQLHFAKEKRRGKIVTIIKPFFLEEKELKKLLKNLKAKLGSGGTIKENRLELQGEVQEQTKTILQKEGFRFKS